MWPFKLYSFFDEINQQICSSKGRKTGKPCLWTWI